MRPDIFGDVGLMATFCRRFARIVILNGAPGKIFLLVSTLSDW